MSSDGASNAGAVFKAWVGLTPDAPAIGSPGRTPLTYRSLEGQIRHVAATLERMGIRPGDRVASVLPNGPEAAVAFLAVSSCAAHAPLNPAYSEREFDFYVSDLAPSAIILPENDDSAAAAVAASRNIPVLRLHPDEPAGAFTLDPPSVSRSAEAAGSHPQDVALMLHTSGTTSRPKLVPLTRANLAASAAHVARSLELTAADRCLNVMPLFHIHGLVASVLASLSAGACVVCTSGFYVTDFFRWLHAERPTWFSAVPTMHQAILERATADAVQGHSLRFIRSSSAALPPQTADRLEEVFGVPVVEAYGMTEAAHQMAVNPLEQRKPGSVGLPAGPEMAVMDEQGRLVARGTTGELVIRGPNVTSGYVENEEANGAAFTDGWFRTGDRGYVDADGYVFVTGRIKEIINRGGEKIAPREIDEALLAHPDVRQAVAFAVPDSVLGEDVAAVVVRRDGTEVTDRQLRAFVGQRLAPFKVPRRIIFRDDIPKGPTGKLQRVGLADRLGIQGHESNGIDKGTNGARPFVPPTSPIEQHLAALWSDVLEVRPVSVDAHFLDLGGDSMLATRLISRIREQLGSELSVIDLFDAPTVTAQAALIENHRREVAHGS